MIHTIRKSKISKAIAVYLAVQLVVTTVQPSNLFALTGGPSQPEFNSFTPIGTSDMVNLSSGDFNYNIPIMDVGGYPLNLAYDSGITMDQEASWVGLGWNLNVGQINRQVRGLPDDFNGDKVTYETDMKDNKTVGMTLYVNGSGFGIEGLNSSTAISDAATAASVANDASGTDDADPEAGLTSLSLNLGLSVQHNNYEGISAFPSLGFAFDIGGAASVGMNFNGSATDGPTATPNLGISKKIKLGESMSDYGLSSGLGLSVPLNSRQGITAFNINTSLNFSKIYEKEKKDGDIGTSYGSSSMGSASAGASITFNDMSFMPQKRNKFHTNSFNGDLAVGGDIWGVSLEGGLSGFGSVQRLADKGEEVEKKTYGYEFTKNATKTDILDFNRENDNTLNKNTKVLPTVNYTYDIYAIQGQGTGGQFRPYKGQVDHVFDEYVKDGSESTAISAEATLGAGAHMGGNFTRTSIDSHTGVWDTPARNFFKPVKGTKLDFEDTYFKTTGDMSVDDDIALFYNDLENETPNGTNHIGGENAIALKITGSKHNRKALNTFKEQIINSDGTTSEFSTDTNGDLNTVSEINITDKLYRSKREKRNQAILKVNKREARESDAFINENTNLNSDHLTNGIKILNPDGATYVYGEAAVNTTKEEVTFATDDGINENSGKISSSGDINLREGTVVVNGNDVPNNDEGIDGYFNRITTPAYAHTFLLSSVLSSDYEDLTGNGPTDDDLGAYTKFHYETKVPDYKWRVPFTDASYNAGMYTKTNDQKGSYVYGEKELKYVTKIETKTHVAIFDLTQREDGYGVSGPEGGRSNDSEMYKINTISLYSKPEAKSANLLDDDDTNDLPVEPIKVAHFQYNYSLCKNLPNNSEYSELNEDDDEINGVENGGGKLTLKKVYFTYRGSKMGKYTPYKFNYDNFNPDYQVKSYDIWGNYKPIFEDAVGNFNSETEAITELEDDINLYNLTLSNAAEIDYPITAQEFPFVQQDDKALQDLYAKSWTMSSIDLPSGGRIEVSYESDDYQYVQDRKAMQMFKVAGVATQAEIDNNGFDANDNKLYHRNNSPLESFQSGEAKFVIVELQNEEVTSSNLSYLQSGAFVDKYLGDHINKPIYFKFLLNMTKNANHEYDYVSGYFNIDQGVGSKIFIQDDKIYGAIPMELSDLEGGISANKQVNPITKAGWYFGRSYLNRYTVGIGDNTPNQVSFINLLSALGSSFASFSEYITGPNGKLRTGLIARNFIKDKSFIRLQHPKNKLGGGLRVSKIEMFDNWDEMLGSAYEDNDLYAMSYGQEYNYNLEDGSTSGVATFEPNASRENPFVEPFYNKGERIVAPKETNYVEKPFGASFFPSATVTYSKVEVKNLERQKEDIDENNILVTTTLKKHATGKVVNEFFTTKDFPTKVTYTNIDGPQNYDSPSSISGNSLLATVLNLTAKTHLTLSQGFSIVTNDMNGKSKSQWVYNESGDQVSGVEYKYSTDPTTGELKNVLPVVLPKDVNVEGENVNVVKALIGTQYDVVTDFRENYSYTNIKGANVNVDILPPTPLPWLVGIVLPNRSKVENVLHTTTTTKVIHKSGILKEKIAYDLGAKVSTKNLAWDAVSGQVLLTETTNEYDDNFYNFSYPAHWAYRGMGQAAVNLGIEANFSAVSSSEAITNTEDGEDTNDPNNLSTWYGLNTTENEIISDYFSVGDQVIVYNRYGESYGGFNNRYWINEIKVNDNGGEQLVLIDHLGKYLNPCGEDEDLTDIKLKIVRSSYRNLQTASMASVTSMKDPTKDNNKIDNDDFTLTESNTSNISEGNPRIINASAVEYKDFWRAPKEKDISYPTSHLKTDGTIEYPYHYKTNPFVYNIKGDWRAVKSYAFLTGRTSTQTNTTRNSGFFTSFKPFYIYNSQEGIWERNTNSIENGSNSWTFASEVSQYSPYGAELENKDALGRYSSAQYGYNYTLPTAVASNSAYRQMGYEGFEYNQIELHSHFALREKLQNNSVISDEEAHTGNYSLKVGPNTTGTVDVTKPLFNDCEDIELSQLDCAEFVPCTGLAIVGDYSVDDSTSDPMIISVPYNYGCYAPGSLNSGLIPAFEGCSIFGGNPSIAVELISDLNPSNGMIDNHLGGFGFMTNESGNSGSGVVTFLIPKTGKHYMRVVIENVNGESSEKWFGVEWQQGNYTVLSIPQNPYNINGYSYTSACFKHTL